MSYAPILEESYSKVGTTRQIFILVSEVYCNGKPYAKFGAEDEVVKTKI